jgi:hypothetical protein
MEKFFDSTSAGAILARFAMQLFFLFVLVRALYFRYTKKENFLFTFFLIGIVVFFICTIMKIIKIELGIGFGLFAIFSILRFRTRNFSIKDMAYIFTTIGISVINALSLPELTLWGVMIMNTIILAAVLILEEYLKRNMFSKYSIIYDNIELLKPACKNKLLKDISSKTGRDVIRVSIVNIDYKRELAILDIYYKDNIS